MNRKMAILAFAGVAAAAAVSEAQTLTTMILNDGAFRYAEGGITATSNRTGTGAGSANFGLANTIATASTVTSDYLFQNWWWYRSAGDTREFALSNQTFGTALGANSAFLRYVEPIGGSTTNGTLTFEFTYTLNQITPTSAAVTINWSVVNNSQSEQRVSFFSYTDYDVISAGDDVYSRTLGTGVDVIRADLSTTNNTQFASVGADLRLPNAWQIGPFSGTGSPRTALGGNTAIDNLNNAINGTNPGDLAGAFQWELVIAPGGTVGGRVTKGYNYVIPAPGALALMGLGRG
jgi:hypothetical protein